MLNPLFRPARLSTLWTRVYGGGKEVTSPSHIYGSRDTRRRRKEAQWIHFVESKTAAVERANPGGLGRGAISTGVCCWTTNGGGCRASLARPPARAVLRRQVQNDWLSGIGTFTSGAYTAPWVDVHTLGDASRRYTARRRMGGMKRVGSDVQGGREPDPTRFCSVTRT